MDLNLWIAVAFSVVAAGTCAWLYSRLVSRSSVPDFDVSWWNEFRPERYRPVGRLLDAEEFEYLRSLRGADRRILSEFRRRRTRIMREYLRQMSFDFGRLQVLGQMMLVSGLGNEELRDELFRQKVHFSIALWRVRAQTLAFRAGVGCVDASRLVGAMDQLALAVRAQSPLASAA